jgi:hypothetical protein
MHKKNKKNIMTKFFQKSTAELTITNISGNK